MIELTVTLTDRATRRNCRACRSSHPDGRSGRLAVAQRCGGRRTSALPQGPDIRPDRPRQAPPSPRRPPCPAPPRRSRCLRRRTRGMTFPQARFALSLRLIVYRLIVVKRRHLRSCRRSLLSTPRSAMRFASCAASAPCRRKRWLLRPVSIVATTAASSVVSATLLSPTSSRSPVRSMCPRRRSLCEPRRFSPLLGDLGVGPAVLEGDVRDCLDAIGLVGLRGGG